MFMELKLAVKVVMRECGVIIIPSNTFLTSTY